MRKETAPVNKSAEAIIYPEPNGSDLMDVFQWFRRVGGNNWILANGESRFAEGLVALSRGNPIDFLIWNCIGFKWFRNGKGDFPSCDINNNLDASITLCFKKRIQETSEMLSLIGNPQITILVPTNEAFDDRLWQYRQPAEEREKIVNETVTGLRKGLQEIAIPDNTTLKVQRWDEFLESKCATKTTDQYSLEGEQRIKEARNFDKIKKDALDSGRDYFNQNGIQDIKPDILEKRQLYYFGVYAGEGVFFQELQARGQRVVVINFEEGRVSQMVNIGSNNNIAIVTPIKETEMINYYRWRKELIRRK